MINKRIPRENYEGDTKLSHDLIIFSFEMQEKARTNHREKEHRNYVSVSISFKMSKNYLSSRGDWP